MTGGKEEAITVVLFCDDGAGSRSSGNRTRVELNEAVLYAVLNQNSGRKHHSWDLGKESSGRPVVRSGAATGIHPELSLSHSGGFTVAAASSRGAVGVDIEMVKKRRYQEIAEYLDWPTPIRNRSDAPDPAHFFQLWTLWEATIKATFAETRPAKDLLFSTLTERLEPGIPSSVRAENWAARSWEKPDEFWLTVVANNFEDGPINLYRLLTLNAGGSEPDLQRIDDMAGCF
jgi:phosphopantetheinyl transferase